MNGIIEAMIARAVVFDRVLRADADEQNARAALADNEELHDMYRRSAFQLRRAAEFIYALRRDLEEEVDRRRLPTRREREGTRLFHLIRGDRE